MALQDNLFNKWNAQTMPWSHNFKALKDDNEQTDWPPPGEISSSFA